MTAPGPYAYTNWACEACEDTGTDLMFGTTCTECDQPTIAERRAAYRKRRDALDRENIADWMKRRERPPGIVHGNMSVFDNCKPVTPPLTWRQRLTAWRHQQR